MASKSPRAWSQGEQHEGEHRGRRTMTVADLCRAIDEQRIPVSRQDDDYLISARDLRRWLDGHERSAAPRRRQRHAS